MAHCSQNVGTRTLNSLSPACSFPVVTKTPDLFHFSVSQTPGSNTRIISVTKNTGYNGNRIQEEGRSINSSGVWQSFPVRQNAMDECASGRFCGFYFLLLFLFGCGFLVVFVVFLSFSCLTSPDSACFSKHPFFL